MIAKKNARFDLEGKRMSFFQVGMLGVGSIVLAAFAWQSPILQDENNERRKGSGTPVVFEMTDKEPEVKPQIVIAALKSEKEPTQSTLDHRSEVNESSTTTKNSSNTDVNSETTVNTNIQFGKVTVVVEKDVEGEIINIPDIDASYIGGYMAMQQYIQSRIKYPQDAIELGMQGKVYVEFVVETDGSISSIRIAKGVFESLDKEAVRLVRNMPKWIPGEVRARKVRTYARLPITFILD
jgi:protein TonB